VVEIEEAKLKYKGTDFYFVFKKTSRKILELLFLVNIAKGHIVQRVFLNF